MNNHQVLLDVLNQHIGTPQLHQHILNDYDGMYSLGISNDLNTGKPILFLSVPKEVEQEFPQHIILDNVTFFIRIDYSLKPITPFEPKTVMQSSSFRAR